jgi:hypothetical protein
MLELQKLHLQVRRRPEQGSVQTLVPESPNQTFDKWMRQRHVGHCLDFPNLQHAKVCLPLVKPIERIVVRAEKLRKRWSERACGLDQGSVAESKTPRQMKLANALCRYGELSTTVGGFKALHHGRLIVVKSATSLMCITCYWSCSREVHELAN